MILNPDNIESDELQTANDQPNVQALKTVAVSENSALFHSILGQRRRRELAATGDKSFISDATTSKKTARFIGAQQEEESASTKENMMEEREEEEEFQALVTLEEGDAGDEEEEEYGKVKDNGGKVERTEEICERHEAVLAMKQKRDERTEWKDEDEEFKYANDFTDEEDDDEEEPEENEEEKEDDEEEDEDDEELAATLYQLTKDNSRLMSLNASYLERIKAERERCVQLKCFTILPC
ncbi:unnamed protein product [Protopolystoma xenopodis]|uniref:Uncharacterized protein n=1 Tax=Protopolystoma xenopodis TaxID=117903 RepID=A0A448WXH5_9PLAT|nr:unnamed protein product [Protopolystoma xenopodis]